MGTRRAWLMTAAGTLAGLAGGAVQGQDVPSTGDADLAETLTYGLKPRTPNEEAFIELVVAKVDARQLPVELVIGTFRWARPKRPYPFPFFERALRLRAAQIGVSL